MNDCFDDPNSEPIKGTGKFYITETKQTGSVSGRINLKGKVTKEIGWQNRAELTTIILERNGKRGIWIELY